VNYTKNQIAETFAEKLEGAKGHEKSAYTFGLALANNLPENAILEIRQTKQGAFNIGDLGEAFVKLVLLNTNVATWSRQGMNDLDRKNLNEIKVFAAANRNPNGLKQPKAFIAVSKFGVHHITKVMVEKYWELFKDNKGLKEPTTQILKEMIENENPKLLKKLTQEILG
jgi:hypothetical protein